MSFHILFLLFLSFVFLENHLTCGDTTRALYICESIDPKLLGAYVESATEKMDDVPVYTNANDMSFFRNKGFWYLGNLGPWPPETHYRCVEAEGCNPNMDIPPTTQEGKWLASKRFGKDPVPVITKEACTSGSEEL